MLPTHSHSGKACGHNHGAGGGGGGGMPKLPLPMRVISHLSQNLRYYALGALVSVVVLLFVYQTDPPQNPNDGYQRISTKKENGLAISGQEPCSNKIDLSRVKTVSLKPRVYAYEHFLSDEEADQIIAIGVEQGLSRSLVAAPPGQEAKSNARTSYGTFLKQHPLLKKIEERIAQWTRIPEDHGESFYLLRYEIGQEYKPHHDYFHEEVEGMDKYIGKSGQRTATVLIYLSTPDEGGETIFPSANNLKVKTVKGTAVLFFSHTPDFVLDPMSLHGSVPVISGTKYCMTKWIRLNPYV